MSGESRPSGPVETARPQPTIPPAPPGFSDLRDIVQKEVDDRTRTFKDLPTPVAFATLENDVKHLWGYFKGLTAVALLLLGGAWTVYSSIDSKIGEVNNKVDGSLQDVEARHRLLEGRVLEDIKSINRRVDQMIIANGVNQRSEHNSQVNKDASR